MCFSFWRGRNEGGLYYMVGSEVEREEELLKKADEEENEARSCQWHCVLFSG